MIAVRVLLVPVTLMALVPSAHVAILTTLVLMIMSVRQLLAATITLSFTAERRLRVLAFSAAFGTAVTWRRAHSAVSRATATTAATTTTPSTAPATRLTCPISALATGGALAASVRTLLTLYASITRAAGQWQRRVCETIARGLISTNALGRLACVRATDVSSTVTVSVAVTIEVAAITVTTAAV
jgi:hypothetical protein